MIKLTLPPKPSKLTPQYEQTAVEKYKIDKTAVWNEPFIKEALMQMSHDKCIFSEQKLNRQSAYMEVEHFKCKSLYPNEVLRWGNLMPISKKCNLTKKALDVLATPIINPLTDNPKAYLFVKGFKYYGRDQKGKDTIKHTAINDQAHFMSVRSAIGFGIEEHLETLLDLFKKELDPENQEKTIRKIKCLLSRCLPQEEYSAVLSTYLLYESKVLTNIEIALKQSALWDEELESTKQTMQQIALKQ